MIGYMYNCRLRPIKNLRKLLSMGSAKVRNALFYVISLMTLMVYTAASCVQEGLIDKAALFANS